MTSRNEILEKYMTEVIKIKDSANHFEEHKQNKHSENMILLDM